MSHIQQIGVKTFDTEEDRLEAFFGATGIQVPRLTAGKVAFFREFNGWLLNYSAPNAPNKLLSIPPDPSLAIAFPYPFEELASAIALSSGTYPDAAPVAALLDSFGLSNALATRPVGVLSGGERLLLALAKATALHPVTAKLAICSPTHWLNSSRLSHLTRVLDLYANSGRSVDVYLLNGEALPGNTVPAPDSNLSTNGDASLTWQLTFGQSTISFPEATFPRYTAASSITYSHPQQDSKLASPTLLVGDNGVGKSVFAKILAGLLRPDGEIRLACGGSRGPARLILQDALPQLFGRSTSEYLQAVFRYDEKGREEAIEVYRSLEDAIRAEVVAQPSIRQDAVGNQEHPDSVLQARLALIAERLVSRPPLLILDEPGWCLSMPLARALLRVTCIEARRRHVGLVVISHLDSWWEGLVFSRVRLLQNSGSVLVQCESY